MFKYFPVALVGVGCNFPGDVVDTQTYWKLLIEGSDGIKEIPPERWDLNTFYDPNPKKLGKHVTKRAGMIKDIDKFDASFFNISPREARAMDPQQRKLLETSWEALEDAGIVPDTLVGSRTGVFVGIGMVDYTTMQCEDAEMMNSYANTGAAHSVAANRISYFYGLRGPSMAVDTACASAITATHLACMALWAGECELALVGGANILLVPEVTVGFSTLGVMAPDGTCKCFDQSANGYVRGEGFGTVVLKPLDKAIADGDRIYCAITGTAVNDNGHSDSLTMPSGEAQEELLRFVSAKFNKELSSVQYVEAHGTGTAVGDPIEANAVGKTLGLAPGRDKTLRIGSVKSNIGHLECAAGSASLIKVALMLKNKLWVPSLNNTHPSEKVDWNLLNMKVQTQLEPFGEGHTVAVVNSFGFGGANAVAICEQVEHPDPVDNGPKAGWELSAKSENEGGFVVFPLSAKNKAALNSVVEKWSALEFPGIDAAVVARYQSQRRSHFGQRLAVVAKSRQELQTKLAAFLKGENAPGMVTGQQPKDTPRVGFVFCGQGPQHYNMGRSLFKTQPIFRDSILECDGYYKKASGRSLLELGLFSDDHMTTDAKKQEEIMTDPRNTQTALIFMQIALNKMLKQWGIQPSIIVGHSLGEVSAMYASGAFSAETAVKLIHIRSHNQAALPSGKGVMIALGCSLQEAEDLIKAVSSEKLVVAAINSPSAITVAGDVDAINELANLAKSKEIFNRVLKTTHAFHSPHMDPLQEPILRDMAGLKFSNPIVPIVSTVTGELFEGKPDGTYWWNNVRQPVNFQKAILNGLTAEHCDIVVEIGPHPVVGSSVSQTLTMRGEKKPILVTAHRVDNETLSMLSCAGNLYVNGMNLNWEHVDGGKSGQWVPLPTYPFQLERYWQEAEGRRERRLGIDDRSLLAKKGKLDINKYSFLADHVVQGKILFPGAGYVELGLEAYTSEDQPAVLEDLTFSRALPWPEGETLELRMNRTGDTYQISTKLLGVHAGGRVGNPKSAKRPPPFDLEEIKKACTGTMTQQECYSNFRDLGFEYGPAFQGIVSLIKSDEQALAILKPPQDAALRLHVTVFDACLQTTLSLLEGTDQFLPVAIGKLQVFEKITPAMFQDRKVYAYARLIEQDPLYMKGDVFILDDTGKVLVSCTDFRGQCVTQDSPCELEKCVYAPGWQEKKVPLPAPKEFNLPALFNSSEFHPHLEQIAAVDAHMNEVRQLVATYAHNAIHTVRTKDISIHERNTKYIVRLEEMANEFLGKNRPNAQVEGVKALYEKLVNDLPFFTTELSILKRIGEALVNILNNPSACLPILYAPDSLAVFFTNSVSTKYYYTAGSEAIIQAVKKITSLDKKRVVRIIELGGRMGGFAQHICAGLEELGNAGLVEYVFTDLTSSFFPHAQTRIGQYPFVKYRQIDIEKDIGKQGQIYGSYDIVIAMDCLHATADIDAAVEACHKLLAPGGWLVVFEPTNANYLADMVFGCLELWWSFKDFRTSHCCLSRAQWKACLEARGFDAGIIDVTSPSEYIHSVMFAQKTLGTTSAYSKDNRVLEWNEFLVFEDSKQSGKDLMAILNTNKSPVTYWENKEEDLKAKVTEFTNKRLAQMADGSLKLGIVYLWSLDVGKENKSLYQLLDVIHALYELGATQYIHLWVLSQGGSMECANPNGGLLVGFLRTAINELQEFGMYTIDLQSTVPVKSQLNHLADIVLGVYGRETELVVRNNQVYTHRIFQNIQPSGNYENSPVQGPIPGTKKEETKEWKLNVTEKDVGRLDKLTYVGVPVRPLEPTQVKIKVQYSGFNFKDLMGALGLLEGLTSKKFVEFGIECAGEVVEAGSGVKDLKVGDQVMAVVAHGGTLASHVVVDTKLVVKKPANIPMLEAGGIPTVYLTAYYTLVKLARISKGETVLIHSASGGVGQAAIMIAQHFGAKVIATAGSDSKKKFLKETYGIDQVSDSHSLAFYDDVMAWTNGRGVDVVLNSLAGEAIAKGVACLAPLGRFVEIGKRDILQNSNLGLREFLQNKSFFSAQLDLLMDKSPETVQHLLKEVVTLLESGAVKPVPTTMYPVDQLGELLRLASTGKHTGKFVVDVQKPTLPAHIDAPSLTLDPKASYVVTGGYGGVGGAIARWMGEHGAKHIILVGRGGPRSGAARRTIRRLEAMGIEVSAVRVDISNPEQAKQIFAPELLKGRQIKGIFHLAAVIEDAFLIKLDKTQFSNVIGPKVDGAWNLHNLSKSHPVEFFVMASSVCGVLGNLEQTNYAAANTFLDALAVHRREQGLPALTLQFGAIRGAGFLDRNRVAAKITKLRGFNTLHITELTRMIERFLRNKEAGVIMLADEAWGAVAEKAKDALKYSHLVFEDKTSAANSGKQMTKEEMIEITVKQLGDILCLPASSISINEPMVSYGIDSLMSVELVNWVKQQFNITVSQMDILGGLSINDLFNMLDSKPADGGDAHADASAHQVQAAPAAAAKEDPLVLLKEIPTAKAIVVLVPWMGADPLPSFKHYDLLLDSVETYVLTQRETKIEVLTSRIIMNLLKISKARPGIPIFLYGHSLGGLIAYQVALRVATMEYENKPPVEAVLVGASPAPTTKLLKGLDQWSVQAIESATEEQIFQSQIQVGTLPQDAKISPELVARLRADLLLLKSIKLVAPEEKPAVKISQPITAFVGDLDSAVKEADAVGWGNFTEKFELKSVHGGHLFVQQHARAFTKVLQDTILAAATSTDANA